MRNPALLVMGRRVLFCGGVSGGVSGSVSYARRVAPKLLREPSDRISFRLIERVGIDLRGDGRRTVTKDLGHGHQRNPISQHQRRRRVPQVMKADTEEASRLERTP